MASNYYVGRNQKYFVINLNQILHVLNAKLESYTVEGGNSRVVCFALLKSDKEPWLV